MKTIKIIDILTGKESPDKFKYNGYTLKKVNESYIDEDGDKLTDHICYDYSNLYDEVEIIEEDKKIEKLEVCMKYDYKNNLDNVEKDIHTLVTKINEIIDKINNINIILSPSEIAIDKCKKIDYLMENKQ